MAVLTLSGSVYASAPASPSGCRVLLTQQCGCDKSRARGVGWGAAMMSSLSVGISLIQPGPPCPWAPADDILSSPLHCPTLERLTCTHGRPHPPPLLHLRSTRIPASLGSYTLKNVPISLEASLSGPSAEGCPILDPLLCSLSSSPAQPLSDITPSCLPDVSSRQGLPPLSPAVQPRPHSLLPHSFSHSTNNTEHL